MRQIGFYFLFILSFVNKDIWGMKAEEEEEEEVNWEEEFNNNYCITNKIGSILNLSDLEELNLYKDPKKELKTLKEMLNKNEINVIEFCTFKENTIKFKVIEEGEKIDGNVTYFSCIDRTLNIDDTKELCGGMLEDKILITKKGKLMNFDDKKSQIFTETKLCLVKKPKKEYLNFDQSFKANNAINIGGKTMFEVFLFYSTIRKKITEQKNLVYENKEHIFLLGYNKLFYYWDNIKKHIYFFQFFTGKKAFHNKALSYNTLKTLKNENNFVVHEAQDQNLLIPDPVVEEEKSCCQKCCDNCF